MIESVLLSGRVLDQYNDAPEDAAEGDVWTRRQLDSAGRTAISGRHTNSGYSGYLVLALQADGSRRKFLNSRDIFPLGENGYAAQNQRARADSEVRSRIAALKGEEVIKVKGGWRFADAGSTISRMYVELILAGENTSVEARPIGLYGITRSDADPEPKRLVKEAMAKKTRRRLAD